MMTNKRLEGLSKQLLSSFDKTESRPNSVYNTLGFLGYKQSMYFSNFDASDFLKLSIMIYSLKETGKFELAYKIFDNLFFAVLYTDSGDAFQKTCDFCDGEGDLECSECDGVGSENCQDCDGDGKVTCADCGGDGEDIDDEGKIIDCPYCDGEGDVSCDDCEGDGRVVCSECDGRGRITCSECDGDGEMIGESNSLDVYYICSWDTSLKNRCELESQKPVSVLSELGFIENKNLIRLSTKNEGSLDFITPSWMEEDEFYCWFYTDDAPLRLSQNNKNLEVQFNGDPFSIEKLEKLLP